MNASIVTPTLFPEGIEPVLFMTGGVESTALLVILKQLYGKVDVIVFDMKHLPWQANLSRQFCMEEDVGCFIVPVDWAPGEYNARDALLDASMQGLLPSTSERTLWFSGIAATRFGDNPSQSVRPNTPFRNVYKEEVIKLFVEYKREDLLQRTHSCQKQYLHCGACAQCYDRRYAFHLAGVEDKTTYAIPTEEVLAGALQRLKEIAYDRTRTEPSRLL